MGMVRWELNLRNQRKLLEDLIFKMKPLEPVSVIDKIY